MKKKISIINYILVTILAMIGCFKIYILNTNIEIKNILGDVIGFEYALAILLFFPLLLQILMIIFSAHTFEMEETKEIKVPKKNIQDGKIIVDFRWEPTIIIMLLVLNIFPISFSFDSEHLLIRISTITAIIVYLILILTSYIWFYYNVLNLYEDKELAKQSIKQRIKNIIIIFMIFVLLVIVPTTIASKVDEIRKEKMFKYVLSDIENPKESSKGYLDIEDIKTRIMNDYYPEDVYYSIVVDHKKDEISFVTYTDNSEDVSAYLYELTKHGYKFKFRIAHSSISKEDIKKYDGIFEN